MSRLKPFSYIILFMPITLFVLLVIYIFQRRKQFDVVFSFGPDSPPADEPYLQHEPLEAHPVPQQEPDDLQKIEGIGPKIASALKNAGISTFDALAQEDADTLKQVLREGGIRVAFPQTWPKQAQLAANEAWEELATYQTTLIGGREK